MSRMNIDANGMIADDDLLPIDEEKEVNGQLQKVKIMYPANITMSEEKTSKAGNGMLHLTLTIKHPISGNLISIEDYLSYSKKAMKVEGKNLGHLFDIFNLDKNKPETDDFLDRWVFVTIHHEQTEGKTPNPETGELPIFTNNRITRYHRQLTADEMKAAKDGSDLPF